MTIFEKFKKIRLDKGLKQQEVAEKLGINTSSYTHIELGKTDVNWSRLLQIAEVFEMDVVELVTYGEELESLRFTKDTIELYKQISSASNENMIMWRNQADGLLQANIELQKEKAEMAAEIRRLKKKCNESD